ncbi:MAG: cobalamin biosynthesis protein, partial [Caldisphaera sp.]|nr:cobalamin biosynthesis protein [Caldisphaera sp.]
NKYYFMASFLLALFLDVIYPYHRGFLLKIHPVHTSFLMSQRLYKPYSSRVRGLLIWILVVLSHLLIYTLLLYLSLLVSPILWIIASAYIIKTSFSYKLLYDIVKKVGESIKENDLISARSNVSQIVRRNVENLDANHIASAAIESLSESFVDSVLSPIFWLLLLGPIGSLIQRIINTLDGSLGFKDKEHLNVGYASAMTDTIINYIPARLSIIIIAISSFFTRNNIRNLLKVWKNFRKKTESKNAGNPMSAMAGSLNISLEKIGEYKLGAGSLPSYNEVFKSLKIISLSYIILIVVTILTILYIY